MPLPPPPAAIPVQLLWFSETGYGGRDVHVVRPSSGSVSTQPLLQYLVMIMSNDTQQAPAAANVTFSTSIPGTTAPAQYSARFGFSLGADGSVTISSGAPLAIIRSFLVVATLSDPALTKPLKTTIRVNIHEGVKAIHLAPQPLHIRSGTQARFSVLAEFTEETVGDISSDPGLQWQVTSGALRVVTATDKTAADRGIGFIDVSAATSAGPNKVKVTAPATLQGASSLEEEVKVLIGWGGFSPSGGVDPYFATKIEGPGTVIRSDSDVRNVLFLPEGFRSDEQALFEQIADSIAGEVARSSTFKPLNLLNERINYYRLWIAPEPDHGEGISVLSPVAPLSQTITKNGVQTNITYGRFLPDATEPTGTISSLGDLIYRVGYPVSKEATGANVQEQITIWNNLYGAGAISFSGAVDSARIFRQWLALVGGGVTPDSDTLFGISAGARPISGSPQSSNILNFHPYRGTREDINVLLGEIKALDEVAKSNVVIGQSLWADPASKDSDLVCFVCNGGYYGGTHFGTAARTPAQVAFVTSNLQYPLLAGSSIGTFFNAVATDEPKPRLVGSQLSIPKSLVAIFAHEMSHAMFCGDEYSSRSSGVPESVRDQVDGFWNLQFADELASGDPSVQLRDDRIRWLWPRTLAAAFMETPLEGPLGGPFTVTLRKDSGRFFKLHDKVRYRAANLLEAVPLDPSDPSFPANPPNPNDVSRLRFQQPQSLFEITAKDPNDPDKLTLTLRPQPGDPPFQNLSLAGNILYKPLMDASGADVFLVDSRIRAHIRSSGPVSRITACSTSLITPNSPQSAINWPAEVQVRHRTRIVALYDGGDNYKCDIYHGAGNCLMRRAAYDPSATDVDFRNTSVTHFCHVCRYLLVDRLDPRRHGDIENDYSKTGIGP